MKLIFIDTSVWYALIDAKDPDHPAVLSSLKEYQGRLLTTNYIFDETVTLLRYRLGWRFAHQFGEQIHTGQLARVIRITPADEQTAWQIFKQYQDKSFSFTDCTSFAVMKRLKIDLALALDNDFRTYGFQCLP
jgi:uncharacterized protein